MSSKPFKSITTTFDDPGAFVSDDPIADATEAYGHSERPEYDTPCEQSPVGQCQYSSRDWDRCIHCGKQTNLN